MFVFVFHKGTMPWFLVRALAGEPKPSGSHLYILPYPILTVSLSVDIHNLLPIQYMLLEIGTKATQK